VVVQAQDGQRHLGDVGHILQWRFYAHDELITPIGGFPPGELHGDCLYAAQRHQVLFQRCACTPHNHAFAQQFVCLAEEDFGACQADVLASAPDLHCAEQLWSELHQRVTLAFLQAYPTPEEAAQAPTEQLIQVLKQAGYTTAQKVASKLSEQLKEPQLQADPITTRTKSRLMLALVAQLLPLLEQIAAYDEEIAHLFLTHEDNSISSAKKLARPSIACTGSVRGGQS